MNSSCFRFYWIAIGILLACEATPDAPHGSETGGSGGSAGAAGTAGVSGGVASGGALAVGGASGAAGALAGGGTPNSGGAAGSNASGGVGAESPAGGSSAGGTSGSGGSSGAGTGGSTTIVSDLPIPPGGGVPKPSGTPGNLSVLDWAGFEGAVSFTFDDSLSSQISNYTELQATGVRMTFYVVSGNNGSSATWSQAADDGHELGNHSAHHCHDNGTGCSWGSYAGSLENEFAQCTTHIQEQFGASGVWTAAAPFGDAGFATAAQSSMFLNRGVQGGQVAPNDDTNPFSLPCFLTAENQSSSGIDGATDSARTNGRWQLFLIHSLGGDGGYNPMSTANLVASINHAKSLGDVWIDSVVNVGAYWRAQKIVSAVTPTGTTDKVYSWTLPAHFPPEKFLRVTVDGGTLKQGDNVLGWDAHGYYEIALDAGSLTLSP